MHKHIGVVHAFMLVGLWYYFEYLDDVNWCGSYLFELVGLVYMFYVFEDNVEVIDVWFVIYGANFNLDGDGKVISVIDVYSVLDCYRVLCWE